MEFQDFIIDIPGHPRRLGENNLLGVQRSLEASTDVHSIGLNIASDCRLSSERERTALKEAARARIGQERPISAVFRAKGKRILTPPYATYAAIRSTRAA